MDIWKDHDGLMTREFITEASVMDVIVSVYNYKMTFLQEWVPWGTGRL